MESDFYCNADLPVRCAVDFGRELIARVREAVRQREAAARADSGLRRAASALFGARTLRWQLAAQQTWSRRYLVANKLHERS